MRWPLNVAEIGHIPPRPCKQTVPWKRNIKVEVES